MPANGEVDLWDWLAILALAATLAYVGALVVFLDHWRAGTLAWMHSVEQIPLNPNRLLPADCGLADGAPDGIRIVRQVNVLIAPLTLFYLAFRTRADLRGRERITGVVLAFGIASLALLPAMIYSVACWGGDPGVSPVLAVAYEEPLAALAYLLFAVIFANGVTYAPALALSRLIVRAGSGDRFPSVTRRSGARARWDEISDARVRALHSVRDVAQHPRIAEVLAQAAADAPTETSAEEFLASLPATMWEAKMTGRYGKSLARASGLRSVTTRATAVRGDFANLAFALLYGVAEQGFTVTKIGEDRAAGRSSIVAAVPSSPLSWEGELWIDVNHQQDRHAISGTVVFPGQKYAWGRGGRILKKLFRAVESCMPHAPPLTAG